MPNTHNATPHRQHVQQYLTDTTDLAWLNKQAICFWISQSKSPWNCSPFVWSDHHGRGLSTSYQHKQTNKQTDKQTNKQTKQTNRLWVSPEASWDGQHLSSGTQLFVWLLVWFVCMFGWLFVWFWTNQPTTKQITLENELQQHWVRTAIEIRLW